MEEDPKYINVPYYSQHNYYTREELRELKRYFEKKTVVWYTQMEEPSIADKLCYEMFKGAMEKAVIEQ
jgi:hypothetical protein